MSAFNKGWYLLYTRPKQEGMIADQLASLHIGYYLPKVKAVRKWSDRVKIVHTPLFPSYLFIHLQQKQDYFASLDTKGALHYVRFGNELARVADSLVDDLKIVVGSGAPVEVSYAALKTGDQLTIAEGPLTGLHCGFDLLDIGRLDAYFFLIDIFLFSYGSFLQFISIGSQLKAI